MVKTKARPTFGRAYSEIQKSPGLALDGAFKPACCALPSRFRRVAVMEREMQVRKTGVRIGWHGAFPSWSASLSNCADCLAILQRESQHSPEPPARKVRLEKPAAAGTARPVKATDRAFFCAGRMRALTGSDCCSRNYPMPRWRCQTP